MVNITNIADVDFNKLEYSPPKTNISGGQTIFIKDNTSPNKRLVLALPVCYLPFGVSDYNGRKSLQFSLKGDSDKMQKFKHFLMQFDAFDAVKTCTGVYLSVLSGECKGLEAFIYGALCG